MSDEPKSTPGPWTVGVSVDARDWPVFRLRDLEDPRPTSPEVQANRALIAAGPVMYEALAALVTSIELWEADVEKIIGRVPRHWMELDRALDALALARNGDGS